MILAPAMVVNELPVRCEPAPRGRQEHRRIGDLLYRDDARPGPGDLVECAFDLAGVLRKVLDVERRDPHAITSRVATRHPHNQYADHDREQPPLHAGSIAHRAEDLSTSSRTHRFSAAIDSRA